VPDRTVITTDSSYGIHVVTIISHFIRFYLCFIIKKVEVGEFSSFRVIFERFWVLKSHFDVKRGLLGAKVGELA